VRHDIFLIDLSILAVWVYNGCSLSPALGSFDANGSLYMAIIPQKFFDSVVAIGLPSQDGQTVYTATGFLYGQKIEITNNGIPKHRISLVTNRHVFGDMNSAILRFNSIGQEPAKEYTLSLRGRFGQRLWCPHSDPNVDIAVASLNVRKLRDEGIRYSYFREDVDLFGEDQRRGDGIAEGDGVFVLGFPLGDVGVNQNYVIVRHGTIARISDTLRGEAHDFIIDSLIFPGNSGGPILTRSEVMIAEGKSPQGCYLLGIVKSYKPYRDIAVSVQTNQPRVIFEENSGLAQGHLVDLLQDPIYSINNRVQGLIDPSSTIDEWRDLDSE
jgi:hypothetical protein